VETEKAIFLLLHIHNAVVEDFIFISLFLRLRVRRTVQKNAHSPREEEMEDLFANWPVRTPAINNATLRLAWR
jgi:hypothetical protein